MIFFYLLIFSMDHQLFGENSENHGVHESKVKPSTLKRK